MMILLSPLLVATPSAGSQTGYASWYGGKFHGRKTANGERYNKYANTCAHKTLRFGTRVRVKNLSNGRVATCRVNDRGPFIKGRIIDVSRGVASKLNMLKSGVARVRITY